MSWQTAHFCPETQEEIIESYGEVCPSCGYISKEGRWGLLKKHWVERSRRWIYSKDVRWWNPLTWGLGQWQYRIEVPST